MQLASYSSQNRTSSSFQRSPAAPPRTPLESVSFVNSQLIGRMEGRSSHSLIPMRRSSSMYDRSPSCCNAIDGTLSSEAATPHGPKACNWAYVVPLLSICASDYDLPLPSPEIGRRGYKEAEMVWLVNQNDASLRSSLPSVCATPVNLKQDAEIAIETTKPQPKRFHPAPLALWHALPPPLTAQSSAPVVPTSATNFAQMASPTDNLQPVNDSKEAFNGIKFVEKYEDIKLFENTIDNDTYTPYILDGPEGQPLLFQNFEQGIGSSESEQGNFWGNINLACPQGPPLSVPPDQFELQSLSTFRS